MAVTAALPRSPGRPGAGGGDGPGAAGCDYLDMTTRTHAGRLMSVHSTKDPTHAAVPDCTGERGRVEGVHNGTVPRVVSLYAATDGLRPKPRATTADVRVALAPTAGTKDREPV